jgi:uncharacterized protein YndB with AHSA1/START domain
MLEFEVSTRIDAAPETVYAAWLDPHQHSMMTGGHADVNDEVGAAFSAWDGYIQGVTLDLEPGARILQRWRTSEFAEDEEDSLLEIRFDAEDGGTRVTIHHSQLPPHGEIYEQGWITSYFEPMKSFFGRD